MESKICIVCGKEFKLKYSNQKCCSKKCSLMNKKNHEISEARRQYEKKYRTSIKYKLKHKKYQKQYTKGKKHKRYIRQYKKSDAFLLSQRKYRTSIKGITTQRKWRQTKKYKQYLIKYQKTPQCLYNRLKQKLKREESENNCIHDFTKEEWRNKCNNYNGICPCCYYPFDNKSHKLSLDHSPSLSKSNKIFKLTGIKQTYTINEVNPLCLKCNLTKNKKDISIEELRKIRINK